MESKTITVKKEILEQVFSAFKDKVRKNDDAEFVSFSTCDYFLKNEKKYKEELCVRANKIIKSDSWKESDIGTGKIYETLSKIIDQKVSDNLLTWRFVDDFKKNVYKVVGLENILYNFYLTNIYSVEQTFSELYAKFKLPYRAIAYLFFIKDNEKYLPIVQTVFNKIFKDILQISFATNDTSWDNYLTYINIIQQIQDFLKTKDIDATLIDAHSFLWTMKDYKAEMEMTDYEKFKKLLEYFVTHLRYVTEIIAANNVNVKSLIPSVDNGNFISSGQGYKGGNIQKQISSWDSYFYGKICINLQATNYKSKGCYLNWEDTGDNVFAVWDEIDIKQLQLTKYKGDNNWNNVGEPIFISDLGLFDGKLPNDNLKSFFDNFCKLYNLQLFYIMNLITLLKNNKNLILTGAPGTGKTYLAKDIAEQLIYEEVSLDKKEQAERLKASEQFKLVQFHPVYSYEDFVRGIVVGTDSGIPEYKTVNKILGGFAKTALENYENSKKEPELLLREQWIQKQFEGYIEYISKELPVEITDKAKIISLEYDGFRCKRYENDLKPFNIKFVDIMNAYIGLNLEKSIVLTKDNQVLSDSARGSMYYLYNKIVDLFKKYLEDNKISYNNLSMKTEVVPEKNYILIIDEINRANLPAVLGELIYALEYRGEKVESMYDIDGDNGLILPPNLYIIGTMNTADRSVGQIDYAIRRRFVFETMLPKELDIEGFDKELFEKISKLFVEEIKENIDDLRKSKYLSDDFRPEDVWLGHSYFIMNKQKPKEQRLNYEIKPILREYLKDGIFKWSEEVINVINELQ